LFCGLLLSVSEEAFASTFLFPVKQGLTKFCIGGTQLPICRMRLIATSNLRFELEYSGLEQNLHLACK